MSANRILTPVPATPEALAGYGWVLGPSEGHRLDDASPYREAWVSMPAAFRGNEDVCLQIVSFQKRPLKVRWMEYHTKHTQSFIPLAGKPFVMVLGKPTDTGAPDPATVQAFAFDGTAGVVMDTGVWHEVPFPINGLTHFACVCTNETNANLAALDADGEHAGGDLDKRNIIKHFGWTFEVAA